MPSIPSAAKHRAALDLHNAALRPFQPGVVTIAGAVFSAVLTIGEFEPKLLEDGINYREAQDAQFDVLKSALPTAPVPNSEVTIKGEVFRVVNSGSQDDYDPAWHITARRFA